MADKSKPAARVTATQKYDRPPTWAILERKLIDLMNQSTEPVLEKYVRPDGSLLWPVNDQYRGIDALDDAYESFHNWPLFYALGGDVKFKDISLFEFDAITRQYERYDCGHGHPMVVKEYEQGYDWFHQGEGYLFLYMIGLADPGNQVMQERAQRFAGFYMNEDPQAPNYDERLKLVRSCMVGSMGPAYRNFDGSAWGYADWKIHYGLPFQDVPGFNSMDSTKDLQAALRMGETMRDRMSRGDVAVNLAITGMLSHAYLTTGLDKYRSWVRDYVTAWMQRTQDNGGIIPDNIGLSGKIGETMNGKWYGGYYGWTWPHGWGSIGDAVTLAAENAMLMYSDPRYLELPGTQMDALIARAIEFEHTLHVPYKYGDPGCYEYHINANHVLTEGPTQDGNPLYSKLLWKDGWFEFMPLNSRNPVHLWFMSRSQADMERILQIRNHRTRDWEQVLETREKDQGGHDAAWVAYLRGEYPRYPEDILQYNLSQVENRLKLMQEDMQDPKTYSDAYLQQRNPITLEGLTQLTLGAPLPLYNGGHLMATVRYFDRDKARPGLPADVAALVEDINPEKTVIHLVNLNLAQARKLDIQAGAYGEHQFVQVKTKPSGDQENQEVLDIHAKSFEVDLLPGCEVRLEISLQRFANNPSYQVQLIS